MSRTLPGGLGRVSSVARILVVAVATLLFAFGLSGTARADGDVNEASCPNASSEGFQPYLPDCRAYEKVSPPFKGGLPFGGVAAVSGDGSRLIGESVGVFAGAESDLLQTAEEFVRSPSGWTTSSVSPPASQFSATSQLQDGAIGGDLDKTLWVLRTSSQSIYAADLYVREPDGTFARVGPMVPPSAESGPPGGAAVSFFGTYHYVGASADLSHVLFAIDGGFGSAFWPGDTTQQDPSHAGLTGSSLYEYTGTGNRQPALVGVNGEGRLISVCSTALGANLSVDVYNAVSAAGGTVFFTAQGQSSPTCHNPDAPEVDELYARLDGRETVPISEPSVEGCSICNVPASVALGRRPAEFQGASADGSKVVFLTEQELFTGTSSMNLYEYDFDAAQGGNVLRVSTGAADPKVLGVARISEDGSHVYFVAEGVLAGENREHDSPVEGGANLYVFERDAVHPTGRLTFIATLLQPTNLQPNDEPDWKLTDARPVQATPDGRFLAFQSFAHIVPGDESSHTQVFEYDALNEVLTRVSRGQAGYADGSASADAAASELPEQRYVERLRPQEVNRDLAISADGSTVVFDSLAALTPGARVAAADGGLTVYEYHSPGAAGSIADGDVYQISDGTGAVPSERGRPKGAVVQGIDPSGADIFFTTSDSLLPGDLDTQGDLYDARRGGGFAPFPSPMGCEGEACLGAPADQPSFAGPGSSSPAAGGGPPPPPPAAAKSKPVAGSASRKAKLAKALRACRSKRSRHKRRQCESQARRRYRAKTTLKARSRR